MESKSPFTFPKVFLEDCLRANGFDQYITAAQNAGLKYTDDLLIVDMIATLEIKSEHVRTFERAVSQANREAVLAYVQEQERSKQDLERSNQDLEQENQKLRKSTMGLSPIIPKNFSEYKVGLDNRPDGTNSPTAPGDTLLNQILDRRNFINEHPLLLAVYAAYCAPEASAYTFVDPLVEILRRTDSDPSAVHFAQHHPRPGGAEVVRSMHLARKLREYLATFQWPTAYGTMKIESLTAEHQYVTMSTSTCDVMSYASVLAPPIPPASSSSSSSSSCIVQEEGKKKNIDVPLTWPLSFTEVYRLRSDAEKKRDQADCTALNCLRLAPMEVLPMVLGAALRASNGVELTLRAYRCTPSQPKKARVLDLVNVSASWDQARDVLAGYFSAQAVFLKHVLGAPPAFLSQQASEFRVAHLPERWDEKGLAVPGTGFIYKVFKSASSIGYNLRIRGAQVSCLSHPDGEPSFAVLRYPHIDGSIDASVMEQVLALLEVVAAAHADSIIHGDIHPFNVIFAVQPDLSTLIDWDRSGSGKYHQGFLTKNWIRKYRHGQAKPSKTMEIRHDRFSLAKVLEDFDILEEKKQDDAVGAAAAAADRAVWQQALKDIGDSERPLNEIKDSLQQSLAGKKLYRVKQVPEVTGSEVTRSSSTRKERANGTNSPLK